MFWGVGSAVRKPLLRELLSQDGSRAVVKRKPYDTTLEKKETEEDYEGRSDQRPAASCTPHLITAQAELMGGQPFILPGPHRLNGPHPAQTCIERQSLSQGLATISSRPGPYHSL